MQGLVRQDAREFGSSVVDEGVRLVSADFAGDHYLAEIFRDAELLQHHAESAIEI